MNSRDFDAAPLDDLLVDDKARGIFRVHRSVFTDAAIMELNKYLKKRPEDRIARDALINMYLNANRTSQAIDYFRNYLAQHPADLEAVLGNARKAEYVHAVIHAFHEVDESFLRSGDYDEVHRWLLDIKGIGEWSAELILWRGLGRSPQWHIAPDSISGRRTIEAATKVYGHGRTLSEKEFLALSARYGGWQGYWLYYLRTAS